MRNLTTTILIAILALISTNSVSAFTHRDDSSEYQAYQQAYEQTKKSLRTLKKHVKQYRTKLSAARQAGNKKAAKRYLAKLQDAQLQKFSLKEDLIDISMELDSFEDREIELIALN